MTPSDPEIANQWNFGVTAYFGLMFAEYAQWCYLTSQEKAMWGECMHMVQKFEHEEKGIDYKISLGTKTLAVMISVRDRIIKGIRAGTIGQESGDDVVNVREQAVKFSKN